MTSQEFFDRLSRWQDEQNVGGHYGEVFVFRNGEIIASALVTGRGRHHAKIDVTTSMRGGDEITYGASDNVYFCDAYEPWIAPREGSYALNYNLEVELV